MSINDVLKKQTAAIETIKKTNQNTDLFLNQITDLIFKGRGNNEK